MSLRIQVLPPALADQIAAGEVVERPASVVKELVENALDAGARRVEIEIERGGLGRIAVADDGDGMSAEEAELSLRRHATSKLRAVEDLFRLSTFGFRGEALPSIASISTLIMTTRRKESVAGHELSVTAGRVDRVREIGTPVGTRVEVRELFANVPARLKFQKTSGVEAGHVLDVIARIALGDPAAHLRLRVDGRVALDLPPHPTLAERAIAVLRRTAPGVAIGAATHFEGPIRVEAHVASPDAAVQSARRVHLVVNRRVVRDRGLLAAVQVGFAERLARGRHPLAVIAIELPPADVDVNVHPQKLEVRLARGAEVYSAVRHAVARAIAAGGFAAAAEVARAAPPDFTDAEYEPVDWEPLEARDSDELLRGPSRGLAYELLRTLAGDAASAIEAHEPMVPQPKRDAPQFLGALTGGYLLFRDAQGVLVVDQHAASSLLDGGAALTPTDAIDAARAEALLVGLRALPDEIPRWRGRRAIVRVPLSELWRRLEA